MREVIERSSHAPTSRNSQEESHCYILLSPIVSSNFARSYEAIKHSLTPRLSSIPSPRGRQALSHPEDIKHSLTPRPVSIPSPRARQAFPPPEAVKHSLNPRTSSISSPRAVNHSLTPRPSSILSPRGQDVKHSLTSPRGLY